MAIDTRQKRFSMLNFSWIPPVVLFEADGTVDADDRAHLLNLYSGIPLSAVIIEALFAQGLGQNLSSSNIATLETIITEALGNTLNSSIEVTLITPLFRQVIIAHRDPKIGIVVITG